MVCRRRAWHVESCGINKLFNFAPSGRGGGGDGAGGAGLSCFSAGSTQLKSRSPTAVAAAFQLGLDTKRGGFNWRRCK